MPNTREKLMRLLCTANSKATEAEAFEDATYAQQLGIQADHLIANGVGFREQDCHWATEQAYKNGYEDGYRDGKNRAMEEIAFPKFLVRQPEPSKEELEALLYSPTTIIMDKESIIPLYPYRWIPVTERLPEKREDVLLCRKWWNEIRNPQMGWYNDVSGKWFDLSNFEIHNVTHWMPLPQPPKGE